MMAINSKTAQAPADREIDRVLRAFQLLGHIPHLRGRHRNELSKVCARCDRPGNYWRVFQIARSRQVEWRLPQSTRFTMRNFVIAFLAVLLTCGQAAAEWYYEEEINEFTDRTFCSATTWDTGRGDGFIRVDNTGFVSVRFKPRLSRHFFLNDGKVLYQYRVDKRERVIGKTFSDDRPHSRKHEIHWIPPESFELVDNILEGTEQIIFDSGASPLKFSLIGSKELIRKVLNNCE